jgi:phosphoglycolate phosphatase-like HAD superfamily hydrolase
VNLAIFDIDGTLTDTNKVDGACYGRAMELEFGVTSVDREWKFGEVSLGRWDTYPHITDSGIIREIFQRAFKRDPEAEEIRRFIERYVGLLKESYRSSPHHFNQIAGAGHILRHLSETPAWKIGIATGGWFALATYKLKCTGISTAGIPLSTADDAVSREDIVKSCVARAQSHYRVGRFSKIVSIGDGAWDIKTARALGLPFIGVGDPKRLTQEGAVHTVQDYRDPDGFVGLLEKAEMPS